MAVRATGVSQRVSVVIDHAESIVSLSPESGSHGRDEAPPPHRSTIHATTSDESPHLVVRCQLSDEGHSLP